MTQKFSGEADYDHESTDSTGVLFCNLGTPEAPTAGAVRRFLREFLSDPRVVEIPRVIWWVILNFIILPFRPRHVAKAYASVWMEGGSPLLVISQRQRDALAAELKSQTGTDIPVVLGMCYGKPSIPQAMAELRSKGVRRLLVLPAYPQYSGTTTAAVFDIVSRQLQTWRWLPELRMINDYHDDALYIEALAESVRDFQEKQQAPSQRLLMSFHGLPEAMLLAGDPYYCQCQVTARLLAEKLGLADDEWAISFQSRLGKAKWLQPYTDKTLEEWATAGVESVDVICPGFSADCLETLEEMAMQNRDTFMENGGKQYRYIPALNSDDAHIHLFASLVQNHSQGWTKNGQNLSNLAQRKQRAMDLGAKK
ncbi:MAG: ferrochelatase [Sulfuriflexus sp.]|nr:ferrochelatase [Sulfuriflexus sp.]